MIMEFKTSRLPQQANSANTQHESTAGCVSMWQGISPLLVFLK
jgi:hypothetical protein